MFSRLAGKTRRIGILVMVVMLAVQPMAGAAVASGSSGPDCESTGPDRGYGDLVADMFVGDESIKLGQKLLGQGEETDCYTGEQVTSLTYTSVFMSGTALSDQTDLTDALIENHLSEMDPKVRSEAKATIVREWENGSNASQIKTAVNQTVDDEYAQVQANYIRSFESVQLHQYALMNQSYQVGAYQWGYDSDPTSALNGGMKKLFDDGSNVGVPETYDRSITLVNGTTINYTVAGALYEDSQPNNIIDPINSTHYKDSFLTYDSPNHDNVLVANASSESVSSSDDMRLAYNATKIHDTYQGIDNNAVRVKDNAAVLVDELTTQYNYSELNITSILSAGDLVANWSTNLNDTGYYSWSAAELSTLDVNGSTSKSFAIKYEPKYDGDVGTFEPNKSTYNGSELNMSGTMFTNWAPTSTNGSFVAGETYQIPENEVVIFAWQETSNTTRRVRLDGNITISSLTNVQTGESLNETSLQNDYNAEFNTSFNESWLEDILAYQQSVHDDAEASSGGGGGGFDWGSFDVGMASIGFLAVIGGAFVLILGKE